ncbi:MAG TPA: BlaI/MecI/CopY family transcriptional regulator [Polyangiaceae bacterium]|nr:BlaI/MecI/CopY family transcriptional regulator [Polyangiaceae bacterium]
MGTEALTDLQLAVMKALWKVGEGGVAEIVTAMAEQGRVLAPTTVATLLQRLSKQGWVAHHKSGRQLLYRAQISEKEAAQGVLQRVVQAFFGGKVSAVAAQLLESDGLTAAELAELRRLIDEKR